MKDGEPRPDGGPARGGIHSCHSGGQPSNLSLARRFLVHAARPLLMCLGAMMTTKAGGCEIHVGYAHTQASKQLNLLACLIRKSDDDSDEAVQHGVDAVEQLLRHAIGEQRRSPAG